MESGESESAQDSVLSLQLLERRALESLIPVPEGHILLMRLRIEYSVKGLRRFLSHKDTVRIFLRAFRYCKIPFRITKGFSHHIQFSSGPARPVGVASRREFLELAVEDNIIDLQEIQDCLNAYLPEGITVDNIGVIQNSGLSDSLVDRIRYRITVPLGEESLFRQLDKEIRVRKNKCNNLIENIRLFPEDGCLQLIIDINGIRNIWNILENLFPEVDKRYMLQWKIERECLISQGG